MKEYWNVIIGIILLFELSACATKGIDPTESGNLVIHTSDSEDVNISNVYVRQFENEIFLHADAKPTKAVRYFHPGHLSFEIFTEDNKKFFNLDVTRYGQKHSDSDRSKMKHVSFWVRMPIELPKNSILKVSHHKKNVHEESAK